MLGDTLGEKEGEELVEELAQELAVLFTDTVPREVVEVLGDEDEDLEARELRLKEEEGVADALGRPDLLGVTLEESEGAEEPVLQGLGVTVGLGVP